MEFNQFKDTWKKSQAEKSLPVSTFEGQDSSSLLDDLQGIEKKVRLKRRNTFILLSFTIIFIVIIFFIYKFQRPTTYLGLVLIDLAVIIVITFNFLNRVNFHSDFVGESSVKFLQHAKKVFKQRKQFMLYFIPFYAVLICGGCILYGIEVLAPASATFKLIYNAVVIVWALGATGFGIRKQMNRYRKDTAPVLERIELLLEQLQAEK